MNIIFFRLFTLLNKLFREQFGVSRWTALRLAYYSGKAAVIFRKSEDKTRVQKYLAQYYKLIGKYSVEDFDTAAAADTELEWWLVHRYPKKYKQTLAEALSEAMSKLYNIPAGSLADYGQARAKAMHLRDQATHKDHKEPNWSLITKHLEESYRALHKVVNSKR